MLKMKLIFVLIATVCLFATVHCDSDERSLIGCFTGLNRCSEAVSWFSNIFLESCNDYCVRGGIPLPLPLF
ncbi:Uncharacterized protein APZ42_028734 [Daphnia magna]|uniref:Uncharacterized protein n=1 Tax=Daphnia magna TaxID=35525 RepID=A0A162D6G3_9CRUS|nr:Uncharacterized protein APZ42_028734 [Daphnia magna]